jgi:hypothetical protein
VLKYRETQEPESSIQESGENLYRSHGVSVCREQLGTPDQKTRKGPALSRTRCFLVGMARFELAASWSRTMRATKLRHIPEKLFHKQRLIIGIELEMSKEVRGPRSKI